MSTRFGFVLVLLGLFLGVSSARAGDAPAHTAAMLKAAQAVAAEPDFAMGVGAPVVGGVKQQGKFTIPTDGDVGCGYSTTSTYNDGSCPYTSMFGRAVNEPDDWTCLDPRQPQALTDRNGGYSPNQTLFAHLATIASDRASLACNWSHFTNNPAAPSVPSSGDAIQATKDFAERIPKAIEDGNFSFRCSPGDWSLYLEQIAHELHFVQDQVSEHHAQGNLSCSVADVVPIANFNNKFSFKDVHTCDGWLTDTVQKAEGTNPQVWCDEAVVAQDVSQGVTVNVNEDMQFVIGACAEGLTLACMGLERTIRHHCLLPDTPKTLKCAGPASDHLGATNNQVYCEGEIFSAGGQDFLTFATNESVSVLEDAAKRWADVCKEPDDPCVPDQCDKWCKRTAEGEVGDPSPKAAGYCINATPDTNCVLHTCQCSTTDKCGGSGQPCCSGNVCNDSEQECGGSTGTCVDKGTDQCMANPFVGTWNGTLTDGRGGGFPASSPFTVVITADPPNILHIAWTGDASYGGTGGYDGTWSGMTFSAAGGRVIGDLEGGTLTMTEADSQQVATLTKAH